MLKKILYIVASFIIGFLVILTSLFSNFNAVLFDLTATAVKNKDYLYAERFFSQVIDNENKFFAGDFEGVHVEIYSALNDEVNHVLDKDGKNTENSYYTLESSIQISVFHIPSEFTLADKYDEENKLVSQGGAEFKFVGEDETVLFPYYSDKADYYRNYSSYSFLPLSVSYSDYVEALNAKQISLDAVVEKVTIYDGDYDISYAVEFTEGNAPSFDTTFHTTFYTTLQRYNEIQKEEAERSVNGTSLTEEEKNSLNAEVKEIEKNYTEALKTGNYSVQHDVKVVYTSVDFIVPMVISAVVFLAIDILLGWFIFRKKKAPTYIPANRKQQSTTPVRQPEQFSRELFTVEEEEDAVDTPTEESNLEETIADVAIAEAVNPNDGE